MKITNFTEATAALTLRYRNDIAFRKRDYTYDTKRMNMDSVKLLLEYASTIQEYGYYIAPDDLLKLMCVDFGTDDFNELRTTFAAVIDYLIESKGAQYEYHTLYGFDRTAYDMIQEGLDPYFAQYIHYIMNYEYGYRGEDASIKIPEKEDDRMKQVDAIFAKHDDAESTLNKTIDQVLNHTDGKERLTINMDAYTETTSIFETLVGSNNPMSAAMKSDVDAYLKFICPEIGHMNPHLKVPCKETLAYLITEFLNYGYRADALKDNINNATDVLRAYAVYSNPEYDGSLSTPPRFKNHLRAEESRFFMTLLLNAPHVDTDVFMYPEYWKRAFERIKPNRCLGQQYSKIRKAASNLCKNIKPQTVNGIAERLVAHAGDSLKDFESGLKQLENFPGVYIRKFDKYVRTYGSKISDDARENRHFQKIVCQSLYRVLPQVESTKMLCSLLLLYQKRFHDKTNNQEGLRFAKPKGKRSYVPLKPVPDKLCDEAFLVDFYKEIANILTQEVTRRFKDLPYMGKVYIDKFAAGVVVPTELREANDSGMHIIGRGSYFRIPFAKEGSGNHDIIVPYIHWTDLPNGDPVDIDLSTTFYNADWESVGGSCWYGNQTVYGNASGKVVASHSGDYTTGGPSNGPGVAEFIIVRRKDAVELLHAKYMVVTTHCYTRQAFKEATTFFGFEYMQERDGDQQLESLEHMRKRKEALDAVIKPERTMFTSNLASNDTSIINVVVDLENGIVWYADMSTGVDACALDGMGNEYRVLTEVIDKNDHGSKFKAMINTTGNNIIATKFASMTQIKALFEKPTLYCGDLMWLHAEVRGCLVDDPEKADVIFTLPNSPIIQHLDEDQEVITPFMVDRIVNEFLPTK